ncbi:hypothetical protein D1007_48717 [Hordeum vulgare]|nr:hypothetical protein D1007_48717 [Hordeum vulgare]
MLPRWRPRTTTCRCCDSTMAAGKPANGRCRVQSDLVRLHCSTPSLSTLAPDACHPQLWISGSLSRFPAAAAGDFDFGQRRRKEGPRCFRRRKVHRKDGRRT